MIGQLLAAGMLGQGCTGTEAQSHAQGLRTKDIDGAAPSDRDGKPINPWVAWGSLRAQRS